MDAFQTMNARRSAREYGIESVSEEMGGLILNVPPDVRKITLTSLGCHDEVPEESERKHLATIMNGRR